MRRSDWQCPHCGAGREDDGDYFSELEGMVALYCEECETNYVVHRSCTFYYHPEPFSKQHLLQEMKFYQHITGEWVAVKAIEGISSLSEERFIAPLLEQLVADGSVEQRGEGVDRQYRLKP